MQTLLFTERIFASFVFNSVLLLKLNKANLLNFDVFIQMNGYFLFLWLFSRTETSCWLPCPSFTFFNSKLVYSGNLIH